MNLRIQVHNVTVNYMYWKAAVSILSGLGVILIAALDYYWTDKRRREFKRGRIALFAILGVLSITGAISSWFDAHSHEYETLELQTRLRSIQEGQAIAEKSAKVRAEDASQQIASLQAMLTPFLSTARQQSPGLDDASAMKILASRLDHLEVAAKDRDLSPELSSRIKALLAPHKGTHVQFYVMASDNEGRRYTEKLLRCFKEAGWSVGDSTLVFDIDYPPGLALVIRENIDSAQRRVLESVLITTGGPVAGAFNKNMAPELFRIVVGPKPHD